MGKLQDSANKLSENMMAQQDIYDEIYRLQMEVVRLNEQALLVTDKIQGLNAKSQSLRNEEVSVRLASYFEEVHLLEYIASKIDNK